MITIIDIGVGNLGAIANMLRKIGIGARIANSPNDIATAEKLVLPGVGAFDTGMTRLREKGLLETLNRSVLENKVPILGICLGAQMLGRTSEEGSLEGLGWIAMDAVRFPTDTGLRVPHMGWNQVEPHGGCCLFDEMDEQPRFYFVHSYFFKCDEAATITGITMYGNPFASAVHCNNIWGVQFHPEKSHRFGAVMLHNFATKAGR